MGMPTQSKLNAAIDTLRLYTPHRHSALTSQQSLTDEAISALTIDLATIQNWPAGAGIDPVE